MFWTYELSCVIFVAFCALSDVYCSCYADKTPNQYSMHDSDGEIDFNESADNCLPCEIRSCGSEILVCGNLHGSIQRIHVC